MNVAAKILTVSDGVAEGVRTDASGAAIEEFLRDRGFSLTDRRLCADGRENVEGELVRMCAGFHGLIVTTGGTGFGARDHTPEATASVVERSAPGIAEAMRAAGPLGRLSRGVAGVRGTCLIVNLPGSPKGALEHLDAVIDVIPHAVALLADNSDAHPGDPR